MLKYETVQVIRDVLDSLFKEREAVYFVDVVIDLILSVPNVLVTILIQETSMCIV